MNTLNVRCIFNKNCLPGFVIKFVITYTKFPPFIKCRCKILYFNCGFLKSGNFSVVALNKGLYKEGGHGLVDNLHLGREPKNILVVNFEK